MTWLKYRTKKISALSLGGHEALFRVPDTKTDSQKGTWEQHEQRAKEQVLHAYFSPFFPVLFTFGSYILRPLTHLEVASDQPGTR